MPGEEATGEHRHLNGTEEDQRSDSGVELEIGEREATA